MSRIAKSLARHRERQHQFEIARSLHDCEAAISFVAFVRRATVMSMLLVAVVFSSVRRRMIIFVVMMMSASVRAILVRLLDCSHQSVRLTA